MLDGHVPLETGETTRDELYLSGLEGETRREREARREGGGPEPGVRTRNQPNHISEETPFPSATFPKHFTA